MGRAKKPTSDEKKVLMRAVAIIEEAMEGRASLNAEIADLKRRNADLIETIDAANRTIHQRNMTIAALRKGNVDA